MNQPDVLRVAFQGERGAFSEEAAVELLGEHIKLVPRPTFESLFAAIHEKAADCLLVPLENSLAGSVHRCYDLLLESSLHISSEVIIPIRHFLIGCAGSSFEGIKTVESHPVALAQCESFFAAHPQFERIATQDTAGSVAHVVKQGDRTLAAIAGLHAAKLYGGVVLRENLEDHAENYTRFVLLGSEANITPNANKLSLVLRLPHDGAALYYALEPFACRGIDLLKIETRPVKGRPWQYHFYLDLQASTNDTEVIEALADLDERARDVRILGCYPAANSRSLPHYDSFEHQGAKSSD
ncbi:MAG TPA: prephenate dehydratase [Pyrinomonadaceae bacterium]|jgi:prephenate dehydratase